MTPQNNLDLQGDYLTHPFAEVLAEVSHARLTGSLRVTAGSKKSIIYFKGGKVAYAVTNARSGRLSELLLRTRKIEPAVLSKLPKYNSDLELASILVEKAIFLKSETEELVVELVE